MSRITQVLLMLNCSNLISLLSPVKINRPGSPASCKAMLVAQAEHARFCTTSTQIAAIYIPKQGESQGYPAAIKHHWILNGKRGVVALAIEFVQSRVFLHCSDLSKLFVFALQYRHLSHLPISPLSFPSASDIFMHLCHVPVILS